MMKYQEWGTMAPCIQKPMIIEILFWGGEYAVGKEITPNSPNGVQLTIDYNIQRIVEDILE